MLLLLRGETFTMDLLEKYDTIAIQVRITLHITLSSIVWERTSNGLYGVITYCGMKNKMLIKKMPFLFSSWYFMYFSFFLSFLFCSLKDWCSYSMQIIMSRWHKNHSSCETAFGKASMQAYSLKVRHNNIDILQLFLLLNLNNNSNKLCIFICSYHTKNNALYYA